MSDAGETIAARGGKRRRCVWSTEQKRQIVAESFEAGSSVAMVARRHGVNANQLFTWRRQLGVTESAISGESGKLVPVTIAPSPAAALAAAMETRGRMEIVLSRGERIIVEADVDAAALARVIKALAPR
jgi:transposase